MQNSYLAYGKHSVKEMLKNPKRKILQLFTTKNNVDFIGDYPHKILDSKEISRKLPENVVHQGVMAKVESLHQPSIEQIQGNLIVILDQVSDPHNIGAIIRSAAAMGACAVINTSNNAPSENAVIAKTAAGGLEIVPYINVKNLSQCIKKLQKDGFWCVALDANANQEISQIPEFDRVALVMGAESGFRPSTAKICDITAKLDISPNVESLNVSVATAIALYSLRK